MNDLSLKIKDYVASKIKQDEIIDNETYFNYLKKLAQNAEKVTTATHINKFIHSSSDLKAIYKEFSVKDSIVDTQSIDNFAYDFVSSASYAQTRAVLSLTDECKKTTFSYILNNDASIFDAFDFSEEQKLELLELFKKVQYPTQVVDSHNKSILFRTNDKSYLNLIPVYSSSLNHEIFTAIDDARKYPYTKEGKEVVKAKKENKYSDKTITYYLNLASQHVGGSQPQNVSHLNTTHSGSVYILPITLPRLTTQKFNFYSDKTIFMNSAFEDLIYFYKQQFLNNFEKKDNFQNRNKATSSAIALAKQVVRIITMLRDSNPVGWADEFLNLGLTYKKIIDRKYELSEIRDTESLKILANDLAFNIANYVINNTKHEQIDSADISKKLAQIFLNVFIKEI